MIVFLLHEIAYGEFKLGQEGGREVEREGGREGGREGERHRERERERERERDTHTQLCGHIYKVNPELLL
jgi:hypothetical protein